MTLQRVPAGAREQFLPLLLLAIERDFFAPARGHPEVMTDNGIRLRDRVWMDQLLQLSGRKWPRPFRRKPPG